MLSVLRRSWNQPTYKLPLARVNPPYGSRNFILPEEYNSSFKNRLYCPGDGCEAPLVFVTGYMTSGASRGVPDLFRTKAGAQHNASCNHAEACEQHAGHRSFDPAIGLRFHLNEKIYKGWETPLARIRQFEKEELLKIDPRYYDRQIVNAHRVADFASIFNTESVERLRDSRLRYQNTLPKLSDFLVAGPERISKLFNALSSLKYRQDGQPRLFYVKPEIWGNRAQKNGTFALHCASYDIPQSDGTLLSVQPRITFGEKTEPPAFDPRERCRSSDPMLVLAVPKLYPMGEDSPRRWILYLDVTNPDLIAHHTLRYAAPKRDALSSAPSLFASG